MSLNVQDIRKEFPALDQKVNGKNLIYLDSAATSLKPQSVIDRLHQFYTFEAANVHRGAYFLSDRATELYEAAREKVAKFINAKAKEIIFLRGTTEGINLIASCLGSRLSAGDEILISDIEHHANIVPWQLLAERLQLKIKVIESDWDGTITEAALLAQITSKSKILALTHASNHLGNIVNIQGLIALAHQRGLKVVIDGAQAIGKIKVDMQQLDCDFYAFSGHKMFSPFGIGVVYGKESLLNDLPPYQGGGSMISTVTFEKTTYNDIPFRFEAGTPNIGGAIALAAAIDFIESIGLQNIEDYDKKLVEMFFTHLPAVKDLQLLGPEKSSNKLPVFAFNLKNLHHSDVAFLLNQQGIAVRAGHHCTLPLIQKLKLTGSIRASFSIYNTEDEIIALNKALDKAKELLQ